MKKTPNKKTKQTVKKTTLNDVLTVIDKWQKNKDGSFVGSFCEFDKNDEVVNDRMIAFGVKEVINIQLKALCDELKKEKKEEFINW